MAIYETVVILDSLLPPKEIDAAVEHFGNVITENGGKVRSVNKWGKRRLAYEIRKKQYGFYFAIEFEGPGNVPGALQADYNYNDNVMRYLTYAYDKHKIKAMEKKATAEAEKAAAAKPVETEAKKTPVKETAKVAPVEADVKDAPVKDVKEAAAEAVVEDIEKAALPDEKDEKEA